MLRRRKVVCSVAAIIVLLGSAGWLLTRPKIYQSTSSVALLPVSSNASVLPNYPNLISSLVPTYIQLVSSPVLLDQVAATLPFTISVARLENEVSAESLSDAAIINIVAQDPDPLHAQEIAARSTAVFLADLQGNGVVVTRVYGRPTVPGKPAEPRTKLIVAVAVALAIVLGLGAGLVWERLFSGEDGTSEPPGKPRPPVLGVIPQPDEQFDLTAILAGRDRAAPHDRWRLLGTNFMYATADQQVHSVTVTSLGPREGKTSVAVMLAASLTELGLSVLLVDAAVHSPALHVVFGLDNGQGLTSIVLDGIAPEALPRPVPEIVGLHVITAGPRLPAIRDEGRCLQQLPKFSSLADVVVVDGPALAGDDDAVLAASMTDAAVLVVRPRPGDVDAGLSILEGSGARLVGTVLTAVSTAARGGGPAAGSSRYQASGQAETTARP